MNEESLFHLALQKAAGERTVFLQEACAGDDNLRHRLEILLQAHDHPGSFLESPSPNQAATVDEPITERPGTVIGPYKLLEQIGEGGFGVVFMAEQQQPIRRKVALKVLKPGMDTRQVVARFEAERQVLALMDHPNITKVLDAGATPSGLPFFVMELVKGIPITAYCDQSRLTLRERLGLFIPVCHAVQHAHQKAVIHRDIKPSNVLVALHDGAPVPKIIDFGIAKAIYQRLTEKTLFTHFGQMIGTPQYMSPEQAGLGGQDVDTRSDIYSLGVLLYELLTGTTPFEKERFKEASYDEMRRIIREEEPPKPSTRISTLGRGASTVGCVQRTIETPGALHAPYDVATIATQRKSDPRRLSQLFRGELDWIVMKALEKDRSRRYETANSFAMDVQRYLADEPVLACPPSAGYRLRKFVSRNKAAITMAAVSAVALLAVTALVIGSSFTLRLQQEQDRTQNALEDAQEQRARADEFRGEAERLSSALALQRGLALCEQGDAARGMLWLAHSLKIAPDQAVDHQQDIRLSLAQWRHHVHSLHGFFPQAWDESSRWVFSPDGKYLASRNPSQVWEIATATPVGPPLQHDGEVQAAVFQSDSKRLATASSDGTVRLWETGTGKPVGKPFRHGAPVLDVAFAPDGKRIVSAGADGRACIWETSTGQTVGAALQHGKAVRSVAYSSDGTRILTGSDDHTACLWDASTGKPIGDPFQHGNVVYAVAFSPDGKIAATASNDNTVRLWDAASCRQLSLPLEHAPCPRRAQRLAFSPDSKTLIAISDDRARLWEAATGRLVGEPLRHQGPIKAAGFSPDGKIAATSSWDGTARLWEAATGKLFGAPLTHRETVCSAVFASGGKEVITASEDGIRIWQVGKPGLSLTHPWEVQSAAISPDGKIVATAENGNWQAGEAVLWEAATGRRLLRLGHEAPVLVVAFSPDGKTLLTAGFDKTVRLWEVSSGKLLSALQHPSRVESAAFHPRDNRLITTARDGKVRIWDLNIGKVIGTPLTDPERKESVVFSPDGKTVLILYAVTGMLYETATFKQTGGPLRNCGSWVYCGAFSPDGRTLVTGGGDGTARLWEVASLRPLEYKDENLLKSTWFRTLVHSSRSAVHAVAFSPDGKRIVTGSDDGTARLWDAATGKPLGTALRHRDNIVSVGFGPDGNTVLTASRDGTARLWHVPPPLEGDVERIVLWTQVLTNMELDEAGEVRVLDGPTWQRRRERLQELGGPPIE